MSAIATVLRRTLRIGCAWTLLLVPCAWLSGCCDSWNLRGDGYKDEESRYVRHMRPVDRDIEVTSFSNKARDIERDMGAPP